MRRRAVSVISFAAVLSAAVVLIATIGAPTQAATLTSADGYTSLSTIGTITSDTPYSSGQAITVSVAANPVIDNANLAPANQGGLFYIEECTDPDATSTNLPTAPDDCESATLITVTKTTSGAFTKKFTLYDLPDPGTLGSPTMTGTCDVAPNQCVIGIFVASPQSPGTYALPDLFSAPFNVDQQADFGSGSEAGLNPGDGSAPPVTATSAGNSTVVAGTATVAADGVNTSQITVALKNTDNNPVTTAKTVTLSQGSGHSTIVVGGSPTATATTNGDGQATFIVSDTTAESVTYTATDTSDSDLVVTQTATVTFSAPVATPSNSSIEAASTSVSQSGNTTITVTLNDQGPVPQPIAGKLIALSQGSGSSSIVPASAGSATTNAQGQATFSVSDAQAETVTYSATDTTDGVALTGLSVHVTFGTLSVSAADSTVTTTTPLVSIVAVGGGPQPTGTVNVTLLDGTSPVSGKTVELTASSTNAVITTASELSGSNGQASFTVSDTTAETVTFSAVDTSDDLPITATTQVTFEAPEASPSTSTVIVEPPFVPADGVSAASITVTVKDQIRGPSRRQDRDPGRGRHRHLERFSYGTRDSGGELRGNTDHIHYRGWPDLVLRV